MYDKDQYIKKLKDDIDRKTDLINEYHKVMRECDEVIERFKDLKGEIND